MGSDGARSEAGYILLSAGIIDSPIWRAHPDVLRLWLVLLCMAHRHRRPLRLPDGREVQQGELVTSLGTLAKRLTRQGSRRRGEESHVTPARSTVLRYLRQLEAEGMIQLRASKDQGTWIRVINFEFYQRIDSYRSWRYCNRGDQPQQPDIAPEIGTENQVMKHDSNSLSNDTGITSQAAAANRVDRKNKVESRASTRERDEGVERVEPLQAKWRVWNEYSRRYSEKRCVMPMLGQQTQTHLEAIESYVRLVMKQEKQEGEEKFDRFVSAALGLFFEMNDPYVEKGRHALGVFRARLPEITEELLGKRRES